MKIQKKSSKKPLLVALVVACMAVAVGLTWHLTSSRQAFKNTGEDTSTHLDETTVKNKSGDIASLESSSDTGDKSVTHEKEKELPQLYEGENANTSTRLTGAINSKSVSGDYLVIRNTINQFIDSGTCELTLTSGDTAIRRSAEIIQNPSSSSCAGFDIPLSELGSGQWSIEIYVSSENKSMTLKDAISI